jgi:hypothetical protein
LNKTAYTVRDEERTISGSNLQPEIMAAKSAVSTAVAPTAESFLLFHDCGCPRERDCICRVFTEGAFPPP